MDDEATANRIRAVLRDGLELDGVDGLAADAPLVSSGMVDSYGLQELGSIFEREFDITVADRDLHGGAFDSIDDMVRFIRAARTAGPGHKSAHN